MASIIAQLDVDEHLQHLHDRYHEDKLVQCCRLLTGLRNYHKTLLTTDPQAAALLQSKLSTPFVKQVDDECAQLRDFTASLEDDVGWTLSYDGADTKVWYRREEGTTSHSIRIHGTIRAPLINIAALLYESDLYAQFLWYITDSTCLRVDHPSPLKRAVHVCAYTPWPMYNRDVALFAFAVDALDDADGNAILVTSRSLRADDPVENPPPAPASATGLSMGGRVVRAAVHDSGFELLPLKPGVTRARFVYNVDPILRFVPMAVVNWAARTLCRWSLRVLEARARDLSRVSPDYGIRMDEQPVYERMRGRLAQYWKQRGVSEGEEDAGEYSGAEEEGRASEDFDADVKPVVPASIVTSLIAGDTRRRDQQKEDSSSAPSLTSSLRKLISLQIFGTSASASADPIHPKTEDK